MREPVTQQRLAMTLAAEDWPYEQVLEIDAGPAEEGRVVVKEKREPGGLGPDPENLVTMRSTVNGERSAQVGVLRKTSRSPQETATWL